MGEIKKKWKFITEDDRPFKRRLTISALIGFAFSFSFIIFGIFDLFIRNRNDIPVVFTDFYLYVLAKALFVFIGITGILLLFKGRLFNLLSSLVLGVLLAGYIQGMFLNRNTGLFTGDRISWENMWKTSLLNIAIWIFIIILPAAVCFFKRKVWNGIAVFLPVILIGAQLSALIVPFTTTDVLTDKKNMSVISTKGSYDVSSKENIIILVLDRLDYSYIQDVFRTSGEEFFEPLDGFTFFNNASSLYARTFPSVTYFLTGEKYLYDTKQNDYFDEAWSKCKFIPELRKNNYSVNLYLEKGASYSDINQIADMTDNIVESEITVNSTALVEKLLFLSVFRYSPDFIKPAFWSPSITYDKFISIKSSESLYQVDDYKFYKNLKDSGLKVRDDKNIFVYHHLHGSHTPYTLNSKIEKVPEDKTDHIEQTIAGFKILYEYLNQLKKLGLYENSTIMIFGDHGKSFDDIRLKKPHAIGMFVKPKGNAGTPMRVSNAPVSQANFQATVLKSAGLNYEAFGQSMFDINENSDNVREFYNLVTPDKYNHILEHYSIKGDVHDFKNWTKLNETDASIRE